MADLRWISTVAYARTRVNFSRVNKTEAMYGRSHMKVKVEPCWNFAGRVAFFHTLGLFSCTHVNFTRVKVVKAHRKLEKKWWKTSVGIYKLRTAVVLDKIASTPTFPHSTVLMEFLYCISTKQKESRWVLRNNNLTKKLFMVNYEQFTKIPNDWWTITLLNIKSLSHISKEMCATCSDLFIKFL